jgi:hypothetical protein
MSEHYSRIENVFEDPYRIRDRGINAKFYDRQMKDGQVYKRICEDVIPELVDALNRHMGRPIHLEGMGWRLNYAGEKPNKAIHSDMGWGTYAAVVYMDPDSPLETGTAFWEHIPSGATKVDPNDFVSYFSMMTDWDKPATWRQIALAQAKFNTAIVYRSEQLHSRWPFEAYGDSPQNGRLTIVAFFS